MNAESFMNLVNENDGFEFVIGYKDFVDHRIGGQGNKYWYFIDYDGKKQEYYVGTYENGTWTDKFSHLVVCIQELNNINHAAGKQSCLTCIGYFNLAKHLTNNNFDMTVINLNTLQGVNLLNFLDDVILNTGYTKYANDVVGIDGSTYNQITLL